MYIVYWNSYADTRRLEMIGIAGGLYSVTALREDDQERVTVYTKHRRTLQAQVTEALGSQDTRRDGGREGEVVLHGGGNAAATKGVLRHLHPLGDSPRRSLADSGACAKSIAHGGTDGAVVY